MLTNTQNQYFLVAWSICGACFCLVLYGFVSFGRRDYTLQAFIISLTSLNLALSSPFLEDRRLEAGGQTLSRQLMTSEAEPQPLAAPLTATD